MKSSYDRLSVQDRNSLSVETPEALMHIMAVLQVNGEPFFDQSGQLKLAAIRRQIDQRLRRTPRLRQVVIRGGLFTGPPLWVDQPGFDIRRHVHAATVRAPGTEAELLDVVATIDERPLDRSLPLWELWLLTGLATNRIALVFKLHHAIADGMGAIMLMAGLFDFTGMGAVDQPSGPGRKPQLPPRHPDLIRDNLSGKLAEIQRLLAGVTRPSRYWRVISAAPHYASFLVRQAGRAPRTSLNRPIGPRRRLGVVRLGLADVKAIAHAHGGKVNDVLLTVIAGGVRALLVHRDEPIAGTRLMAGVAVSMRHDSQLGNQVGTMIVGLPVDEPDLGRRLDAVIVIARAAKRKQSAAGGMMVFSAAVLAGFSRWLARHQRFINVLTTNVAGPPAPIEVLGARVLDVLPVTPIAGNCSLGFGALSYNGCLALVAVADAEQVADLDVVLHGIEDDWLALSRSPSLAEMAQ